MAEQDYIHSEGLIAEAVEGRVSSVHVAHKKIVPKIEKLHFADVKINLIAGIFGTTGYASHGRQLFNALWQETQDIHLETQLPQGWELLVSDAELKAIKNKPFLEGVTVMIGIPTYWPTGKNIAYEKFYGFCVWEGDKVPVSWLEHLAKADGILVPSKHVYDAIIKTTLEHPEIKWEREVPIHILPHGVDLSIFQPQEKPADAPFTFFANKGWSQGLHDRGGIQFVLRAFCEEFTVDEPVKLHIKINTAYCPQGWDLLQEVEKLKLPPPTVRPEFNVSINTLRDLPALVQMYAADCFVAPAMAEAFNLPCAEAMACGLPVITTDFGGQTDYCDNETGWIVPTQKFMVEHDVQYEGVQWGRPIIAELRRAMREAYSNPTLCKEKGAKAQERIQHYTWQHTAKKLLRIIEHDLEGT